MIICSDLELLTVINDNSYHKKSIHFRKKVDEKTGKIVPAFVMSFDQFEHRINTIRFKKEWANLSLELLCKGGTIKDLEKLLKKLEKKYNVILGISQSGEFYSHSKDTYMRFGIKGNMALIDKNLKFNQKPTIYARGGKGKYKTKGSRKTILRSRMKNIKS